MRKILLLTLFIISLSCTHAPTRADRMERQATDYLQHTTKPLKAYPIVAESTESPDTLFVGFVGYRCSIDRDLSVYKVVFVGVQGDSIVYVGNHEGTARFATFGNEINVN
jgi:hypothetical protein